jgi:hypothetical protein
LAFKDIKASRALSVYKVLSAYKELLVLKVYKDKQAAAVHQLQLKLSEILSKLPQ